MKKVILFVLLVIIHFTVNAQEHLKFKGIEINGNVSAFGKQLEKAGYKLVKSEGHRLTYTGEFATYKNCEIILLGSSKSQNIWKVVVYLPKSYSWSSAKDTYGKFKIQLSEKYGVGSSYEFFKSPYYEGDGCEFQAISNDKGTYSTYWKTINGYISLNISFLEQVTISYEDSINSLLDDKEKANIISQDI